MLLANILETTAECLGWNTRLGSPVHTPQREQVLPPVSNLLITFSLRLLSPVMMVDGCSDSQPVRSKITQLQTTELSSGGA